MQLGIAVACAVVLTACLVWFKATRGEDSGWKRVEFHGVRVSVPANWKRVNTSRCDEQAARWAPPRADACGATNGLTFEGLAMLDGYSVAGIENMRRAANGAWVGRVDTGDFAVFALDFDPDLVEKILRSIR